MHAVLNAWSAVVDDERVIGLLAEREALSKQVEDLAGSLSKAREENERLFRDNAHLVRIIDSGDWGSARIAELVQTGAPGLC